MVFLQLCGIYFLVANRKILHSEIHVGFISKLGTEVTKIWLAQFFFYNASLYDLNFN